MTPVSPSIAAHAAWRVQNAEWLCDSLHRLRLRLQRRALWLHHGADGPRAADWLLAPEDVEAERRFLADDPSARAIEMMIETIESELRAREQRMRAESRPPALLSLAELADLAALETDLLLLAAAPALDGAFERAYAELHDDPRRDWPSLHLALGLYTTNAFERMLAADALMPGGTLRALRLVNVADDTPEPLLSRALTTDERLTDYLRGVNRTDERLTGLLTVVPPALCTPASERAAEEVTGLITAEPSHWPTINLVGAPDAGARDVAASACDRLGLHVHALDVTQLAGRSTEERGILIALLGREALLAGLAVVVDGSQAERGSPAAAVIDELVTSLAAPLFVVSAERWPTASGVPVVHVARPSRTEQSALWRAALAPYRHSVNGEIDAIVQQFDFGPPAIADAVARAARRVGAITGTELWESCREQSVAALDELARRITPCYGWDDIVIGTDVRAQLHEAASQVEQRGRVYETWGFGAQLGRGRGISALFSGPSGTGKTMAAEILAGFLGLDLYRIDLAGVVSKYMGETEKNLRRVFDAAEQSGAILFFDEADALFGTRTEVRDSHDRYANVEINYLLQRMEDYAGLAILATNRRGALDAAFLRRLRFVIEFPFPAADDLRRIWERVFPAQAELQDVDYSFLSRLELSGGNIRSIAVNAAFLAATERVSIGMPHLARAAAREYTKLSKPISAAEFGPYYAAAHP